MYHLYAMIHYTFYSLLSHDNFRIMLKIHAKKLIHVCTNELHVRERSLGVSEFFWTGLWGCWQEKRPMQEPGLSAGVKAPFSLTGPMLLPLYFGSFKWVYHAMRVLRCQNVTFCPLCPCGEPQLSLHLLFWPFGSLKEELLFVSSPQTFVLPRRVRRRAFFPPPVSSFLKFCSKRGADKKGSSRGILNENKNQLGHGLVTICGAAVWRSERKERCLRWLEQWKKARSNQICSGVWLFKVKMMLSCVPEYQPRPYTRPNIHMNLETISIIIYCSETQVLY